jgi:hypothetical protein
MHDRERNEAMNLHLTSGVYEQTEANKPRRQVLLSIATTAILAGAAFGLLHVRGGASWTSARPAAQAAASLPTSAVTWTPPAYRTTYYLVRSEEQAAHVRAELETTAEEAAALSVVVAPSEVVVISSPEEQAVFEAGINECVADPGCLANESNVVVVPDQP